MSTIYMQRQSNDSNKIIPNNAAILFGNELSKSNSIEYDSATGAITLQQTGVYYIYWSLITTEVMDDAEISVVSSKNEKFTADTESQGRMIVGSTLLRADETGYGFSILNTSGHDIQLADAEIAGNLVIHCIEFDSFKADPDIKRGSGSVVNFNSGTLDITNPLTYPILLNILQIGATSKQIDKMLEVFTTEGLEELFMLPKGLLNNVAINLVLGVPLAAVQAAISALITPIANLFAATADVGLFSVDSFIGHNSVGIVPAVLGADLPVLSLVAGPPYPQIIAKDGIITSFAANYEVFAACDVSLLNILPGLINTVNNLIVGVLDAVSVLVTALGSIANIIFANGANLPSDYADRLNALLISQFRLGTPETNHHVHAILWKGSQTDGLALGGDVTWEKVSDLDLGPVQFLDFAPVDVFVSTIGDIMYAGGNVVETVMSLLSNRSIPNLSPTNLPFLDAKTSSIKHPIKAGDYLMVQYTLMGEDNTTILVAVLATNMMASVQIDNVDGAGNTEQ